MEHDILIILITNLYTIYDKESQITKNKNSTWGSGNATQPTWLGLLLSRRYILNVQI